MEKGGIIKPHVPVIIGPRVPSDVIEKIVTAKNSPLEIITGHFENFEEENCALAKKALQFLGISNKSIAIGLKTRPSCRMELVSQDPPVILDVGHNPDGLSHLFQALKKKIS